MMTRFVNYLASAAFALATLGMGAAAHASTIKIRVDNRTNPSGYENAKSTGTLTVCISVDTVPGSQCASKVLEVVASNWDFIFSAPGGLNAMNVNTVTLNFHAPGDTADLLVVDQVEVIDDGGNEQWDRGVDNEEGWCFSSDQGDFSNSHCGTGNVLSPTNNLVLRRAGGWFIG